MSDGFFTVGGLLRYLKDFYDVIAITDHNTITVPHPIQVRESKAEDLLILRGIEITLPSIHFIAIEPLISKGTPVEMLTRSRLAYIAHPSFSFINPLMCVKICKQHGLNGVEQYTTGFVNFKGDPEGMILYAGDDLHIPSQVMTSWIEMDVDEIDKEIVIEKLIKGDFDTYRREWTYESMDKQGWDTPDG